MVDPDTGTGIEHGEVLIAFATAVLGTDPDALRAARQAIVTEMGPASLVAVAIIAGGFSLVDRCANGIGIAVEPMILKPSEEFRARLGINDFPSAVNSLA